VISVIIRKDQKEHPTKKLIETQTNVIRKRKTIRRNPTKTDL
jgi:hypothetical protein